MIQFVKQKDFLRKTCCYLLNRIYNKTLNDFSLGKSVSFVSLESQCFPQPELGTHIFVYLINRDKTHVVEWVLTSHCMKSLMQYLFFDISCSPLRLG